MKVTCLGLPCASLSPRPPSHVSRRDAISFLASAAVTQNKEANALDNVSGGVTLHLTQTWKNATEIEGGGGGKIIATVGLLARQRCSCALRCPWTDVR